MEQSNSDICFSPGFMVSLNRARGLVGAATGRESLGGTRYCIGSRRASSIMLTIKWENRDGSEDEDGTRSHCSVQRQQRATITSSKSRRAHSFIACPSLTIPPPEHHLGHE